MLHVEGKIVGGSQMVLEQVRDNRMLMVFPMLDDDYIEKMANFYTSEAALVIFPNLHHIPFSEWLYRQYFLRLEQTLKKKIS